MGASLTILVRLAGLEPAAYGLGIHRSIRLSYKRSIAKRIFQEPCSRKMGWVRRLELPTSGSTVQYSNQLSYTHHTKLASPAGLEPATDGLEIRCSIQLSYGPMVGASGFEPPISWSQTMRVTKLRHTPSRKRIHTISQKSRSQRYGPLKRTPQSLNGLCSVTDMVFETGIHLAEGKRVAVRGKQRIISKALRPTRFWSHGSGDSA